MNNEVEYWLANKDPDRIIPVLTDGEFGWANSDIAGDAVPPALQGAFSDEPRWVDLRFTRTEEQLNLNNPRFSAAIADVAAAIRGVPKDELESEEVRQHRRAVRTAWAAGIALLLLVLVAGAAALLANAQRNEADTQRAVAETERDRADAEAERATASEQLAQERAEEASLQADLAKSRELSASSTAALDEDPELATMLALESVAATPEGATPSPAAVRTLRTAVLDNQLHGRVEGTGDYARISPDGTTLYHSDVDSGTVVAVELESGRQMWSSDAVTGGSVGRVEVSPDGSIVTVQVHQSNDHEVIVIDAVTGGHIAGFKPGNGCPGIDLEGLSAMGGFSPGGQWFTVFTGGSGCRTDPFQGWVAVYDTATWAEAARLNTEAGGAVAAQFDTEGTRVVVSSDGAAGDTAELRTFPDLNVIHTYEAAWSQVALSPDGQRVAFLHGDRGPILAVAETGEILSSLSQAQEAFLYVEPFVFSPDGSKLLVAARARDLMFDGRDGQFLGTLGATGPTVSGSFTADGSQLLTTTIGDALVWGFGTGRAVANDAFSGDWINPEQATEGPAVAVNVFDFERTNALALIDPTTGEVRQRDGLGAQLADGRFVVLDVELVEGGEAVGPLELWNPGTGASTLLGGCRLLFLFDTDEPPLACPDGAPFFGSGVKGGGQFAAVADPSGSAFAAQSIGAVSGITVWDQQTVARISDFEISPSETLVGMTDTWLVTRGSRLEETTRAGNFGDRLSVYDFQGSLVTQIESDADNFTGSVEFSSDRTLLFARDASGLISIYNTEDWEHLSSWVAHSGFIRGWGLSENGERLATASEEGTVHVWNISTVGSGDEPTAPDLTIPIGVRASDVVWESDDRLVVFLIDRGTGARWFTAYLNTGDLVREASAGLTRGFTEAECETFQLDPCPSLADIQSRSA